MDFKTERHRDRSPLSQINVTPLVDVMLVLLIIFMVTASMGQQGITVTLPRAKAQPLNVASDMVTVSIDKDRKVYLNATLVSLEELGPMLKALYQNRVDKSVYLKSDAVVPYGDFVKVVAVVKSSGVDKLGMLTEVPKD